MIFLRNGETQSESIYISLIREIHHKSGVGLLVQKNVDITNLFNAHVKYIINNK
jgi:hypothetical protein